MYAHPIRDPFVFDKIKEKINILKKLVEIGESKNIPHKPIGGNRKIGKKHRKLIEDYYVLSDNYNIQKEINNQSLTLIVEILDLVINMIPVKRY